LCAIVWRQDEASGGSDTPLLRETFAAEDGAALGGAKGDGRLLATLGAGGSSLDTRESLTAAHRLRRCEYGHALGFAVLATLGFVLELFVAEKQLFPGGKDKVSSAVDAGQYFILKFH
jgi:hypothetical protein